MTHNYYIKTKRFTKFNVRTLSLWRTVGNFGRSLPKDRNTTFRFRSAEMLVVATTRTTTAATRIINRSWRFRFDIRTQIFSIHSCESRRHNELDGRDHVAADGVLSSDFNKFASRTVFSEKTKLTNTYRSEAMKIYENRGRFLSLFQYCCRDGQSKERAKFSTVGIPGDYWFCLKFRFGVRSAYPIFAFRWVQVV